MSTLYVVATPIGNLSDFSPRAIETLQNCTYVLAEDTRRSGRLMAASGVTTPMRSYHQFNERKRTEETIDDMTRRSIDVALITDAGTPCISDPGYLIVEAAHKAGLSVIGVPGPSAFVTALSVSGLPTDRFAFHGFLPRKKQHIETFFNTMTHLAKHGVTTHVAYESPKRIISLLRHAAHALPGVRIAVSTEMTKRFENNRVGDADELVKQLEADRYADRGEYTVVFYVPPEEDDGEVLEKEPDVTPEALIVDAIVRRNLSMRDAIDHVAEQANLPRNDVYAASLTLKQLFQT